MTGPRTILHVDMDAFFVSVEQRRDPSLVGRPVIVGGEGRRGVVAAASYEARAFGVHSAMPSVRARRLCPDAVFVPGRHADYRAVSERVMEIFSSFTPLVEPLSLDEAFLDVTGSRRLHGDGVSIASRIREMVVEQEGCSCSVGISAVKFVAKLASEAAKPTASPAGPVDGLGVFEVAPGEELAFLHPLPVRALWGIGRATRPKLDRLGVKTVGELAQIPEKLLVRHLGDSLGRHLHRLSHGVDDRDVVPHHEPKSIGHEQTFSRDKHGHEAVSREIVRLADSVAHRARSLGYLGRTVTLKLRFGADFSTITRSVTLDAPTATGTVIARHGKGLLAQLDPTTGVRLVGLALTGLSRDASVQLSFASDDGNAGYNGDAGYNGAAWDDVAAAMDEVRARFGRAAVVPATLARRPGLGGGVVDEGDGQRWGPSDSPG